MKTLRWPVLFGAVALSAGAVVIQFSEAADRREEDNRVVTICYVVPHAKGEALADFLFVHARTAVVEAKVHGDQLAITAKMPVQRAMMEFLGAIRDEDKKDKPGKNEKSDKKEKG